MKRLPFFLGLLCLFCAVFAQTQKEIEMALDKPVLISNPLFEMSGTQLVPHGSLPYVFTFEPREEAEVLPLTPAKSAGCDAKLTYVGHDNEWALIPQTHLPQTFHFYGKVTNEGDVILTNVKLTITIYNSSDNVVFTATSAPVATLGIGDEILINISEPYIFATKDDYTLLYKVTHDCTEPVNNSADNTLYRWVQITDNVMAKFTEKIPLKTSNFIFGEGNVGILTKMEKTEILTGVSYKTYSVNAANPARAAVYEVEMGQVEIIGWIYNEADDSWSYGPTGEYYEGVVNYTLLARSDDGIPMKMEAFQDFYLPIDRALNNPTIKGVKLEAGKTYFIASDGNAITTANTEEYQNQYVWGKANVGDNQRIEPIKNNALAMVRMHFGNELPLPNVDVGVKEIVTPKTTHAIPSMLTVKVDVKNYGLQPITSGLKVFYQYNDGPTIEKAVTTAIDPFKTLTVTFDNVLNLFQQEMATLKVWTSLAGDENAANNEVISQIEMVNPNFNFNFELPDWHFYSWNATESRNRFAPWKTVDEDAKTVKSIVVENNYLVQFASMGASFGGGNVSNGGLRSFQGITPYLTSPSLMDFVKPHRGNKIGWVACPQDQAKDWMISPKVKLSTNSAVELWAMALDGGNNVEKMKVLVSTTDNQLTSFVPVSGDEPVTIPKEWTKLSFDISQYDEQEVFVAIHYCSNNQLFAAFDDILIKTDFVPFTDLVVVKATSPTIITDKKLTVVIQNMGNKPVESDLTLSYRLDGGEAVTIPFSEYPINGGVSKTVTFPDEFELSVGIHTFKIWVNYAGDSNHNNDTLVYKIEANPVAGLKLTFEEFINFSENYYPWLNLDIDKSLSYNLGNPYEPVSYTKEWTPIGFIAFNPYATVPKIPHRFQAYEGEKFGASIRVWNPTNKSNDWLISPKVQIPEGFNYFTLMVKSSYAQDLEKFNVLISTTDANPASFTPLSDEPFVAPAEWTEWYYKLDDYVGKDIYIAVQCVSETQSFYGQIFMIDNVEVVLNEPEKTEAKVIEILSPSSHPKQPFTGLPVKVKIANSGNTEVTPLSISMQLNSSNVVTEDYLGGILEWKQKEMFEFDTKIDVIEPGINVLKVWVNYEGGSSEPLEHKIYINPTQKSMKMDFEDAYDFTTVLSPWSNIDVDGEPNITFTLTLSDGSYPLIYPGYLDPQSFVVFNPSAVKSVPNLTNYIRPKSGDRIAISVRPVSGNSNDWFISPKITLENGKSEVSFFARGLATAYPEHFKVLVSTTNTDQGSFTAISGASPVQLASSTWTEFKYSLSDYKEKNVYVAIQCVSGQGGAMFMIDDIVITTEKLGVKENEKLKVTVLPNPTHGNIFISADEIIRDIEIFDIFGRVVLTDKVDNFNKTADITALQTGLYFIKINMDTTCEVKKIVKN